MLSTPDPLKRTENGLLPPPKYAEDGLYPPKTREPTLWMFLTPFLSYKKLFEKREFGIFNIKPGHEVVIWLLYKIMLRLIPGYDR